MLDAPVGIGQAIDEASRAREEKEKQEWEAIAQIGEHIADYLNGGPDLEAEDVELGRRAGVTDLEVIGLRWKVVRKKRKAKLKAEEEAQASLKNPSIQPIRVESEVKVVKPVVEWRQLRNGAWEKKLEGETSFRRHFGPRPELAQPKPKPEEPGPPLEEEEPKKAAVVALKPLEQKKPEQPTAVGKPKEKSPLGFQHSKNPAGIPASLENAITAINALGAECRYDVFHDRIIVKGHECGVRGDALGEHYPQD